MKCYQHPETDAVGICRHCAKGVCKQCGVLVENCLACRYSCEQQVARTLRTVERGTRTMEQHPRNLKAMAAILGLAGGAMVGYGFTERGGSLLIVLGAMFLAFAAIYAITLRRLTRKRNA